MPKGAGQPGGFNTSSKLLSKKWEERNYKHHQQKVSSVKHGLDNNPPRQYPHMVLRLKKVQKVEERQELIDQENHLLLDKMTHIMKNRGRVDNWNPSYVSRRTLHQSYREREQEKIQDENLGLARRLGRVRPVYDIHNWENNYQRHEYYLDLWAKDTKDYTLSPRRDGHRDSDEEGGQYDSDFEDDSKSNSSHLPKIESRESTHNDRGRNDKKSSSVTKLPKIKSQTDAIAEQDAKVLFKASKQMVKGDQAVLQSLIKRSHAQRMATKAKFREMYDLDLETELKGGLHREYGPLIEALLAEREEADADQINKAVRSNNTAALTEILCTRNSSALGSINKTYSKKYSLSLDEDIDSSIKDDECRLMLLALISGNRPKEGEVDEDQAEEDAEDLHKASKGRFKKDGKFLDLVGSQSMPQIKALFASYPKVSGGKEVTKAMQEDRSSKEFVSAVDAMSKCMSSGPSHYAEKINSYLKTGNTKALSTLLLARAEVDLPEIRKAYKKKYGTELTDDLQSKGGREVGPLLAQIALKQPPGGAGKEPRGKDQGATGKGKSDGKGQKKGQAGSKGKGTVTEAKNFNPDDDVKRLYEAMKGLGTDEDVVIDILANRSNEQRQQLKKKYKEQYKKDLIMDLRCHLRGISEEELEKELESELSGDFEEVILGLMSPPTAYDMHCLNDAMSGAGTREAALIGILATRSPKELNTLKSEYKKKHKRELVDDVKSETSGGLRDLLVELCKGERDQGSAVDRKLAKEDAKKMHKEGSKGISPEDKNIVAIFTKRNKAQLQATSEEYKKLSGKTVEDGIKGGMSGDAEDAYMAVLQAGDPVEFYAHRLHSSMDGLGTNDTMLIRIIVSRSEVDLADIKVKYKSLYGKKLEDQVESECSGDYKKALLAILKDK